MRFINLAITALLPLAAQARRYSPSSSAPRFTATGKVTTIAPFAVLEQPVYASIVKQEPGTTEYYLQCPCYEVQDIRRTTTSKSLCECDGLSSMIVTAGPTSWALTHMVPSDENSRQSIQVYNCSIVPSVGSGACLKLDGYLGSLKTDTVAIPTNFYAAMVANITITAGLPASSETMTTQSSSAQTEASTSAAASKPASPASPSPTSSSVAPKSNAGSNIIMAGAAAFGAVALAL